MYQILLMSEGEERFCWVKDYLQISGCTVRMCGLEDQTADMERIRQSDLILIHCSHLERLCLICESVRAMTTMPIVVLSQNAEEWAKIRMFQAGVDDYLVEPVAQGELIARVKARITNYRRLTHSFNVIRTRGLEIETFTRRVRVDGVEIRLTAREFDVLQFLAENPDKVLTKDHVYDAVWKEDQGNGYYNSVAIYVKRLRHKIEVDPNNPQYIETIWGVGYRFRA